MSGATGADGAQKQRGAEERQGGRDGVAASGGGRLADGLGRRCSSHLNRVLALAAVDWGEIARPDHADGDCARLGEGDGSFRCHGARAAHSRRFSRICTAGGVENCLLYEYSHAIPDGGISEQEAVVFDGNGKRCSGERIEICICCLD